MPSRYPDGNYLKFDWPIDRVLRITMSRGKLNEQDFEAHHALAEIWKHVDEDPEVDVVILAGEGKAFSIGGEFPLEVEMTKSHDFRMKLWKDGRDIVKNAMEFSKPLVAAINGPAAGGALAIALLADVSIVSKSTKIISGHTRIGVAAGDHAVLIWPLLCGLAKAKRYVLKSETIGGEEAERIGLVSMCVEDAELQARAVEEARQLAELSPAAVRLTKYAMNNWLRSAWPIFDTSLALEMFTFGGPEAAEGVTALVEQRRPKYVRKS